MEKKKKKPQGKEQQPKFNKRKTPETSGGEGLEEFVSSEANFREKDKRKKE